MDWYTKLLFLVHIGGAIVGFGPTFAFGLMGSMVGKTPPPGNLAILETMVAIGSKIVTPVAVVTQPISGLLLIFELDYDDKFLEHDWLPLSIALYAVMLFIALAVNNPAIRRVIALARAGQAGTPEFEKAQGTTKRLGPLLGILTATIVVLMITRPGS